jgi:hypothetical protein
MTFLIYFNLAFIVLNTYLAATTESRAGIVANTVAACLNLLAVVVHLIG